jgi:tetratricopeptide (TPR) repeat protein
MANSNTTTEHVGEAEAALLDAELFIKYKAPEKAIRCLRSALDVDPRSIPLRERLREISATHQQKEEAARQCLALAKLYIERDDFDRAHDRLLEAKRYDARINIAGGLEAIRRARRPDLQPVPTAEATPDRPQVTLAGDLSAISVFDAIQVIENAKLTGTLILSGDAKSGNVIFNEGKIVDAEAAGLSAEAGFRQIVEITGGGFEFQKSQHEFPIKISSPTNTNLILDTLRRLDEENQQ